MSDPESRLAGEPDRLVLAMAAVAFLFGAVMIWFHPWNHDVAWLLHAAREVLGGADLYVEVIEPNPPLIVYGLMPVVVVAGWLGLAEVAVYRLLTLVLTAGVLGASGLWLRRGLGRDGARGWDTLLLVSVLVTIPLQGFVFGQRDPLVALLLLPYLTTAVCRAREVPLGRWEGAVAGFSAAMGIALKPFVLVVWLGVEAYLIARRGWRVLLRPEWAAAVASGVGYLTFVVLVEPDFIAFSAGALGAYRDYFPAAPGILLKQPAAVLGVVVMLLAVVAPSTRRRHELRRVLMIATLGFLVSVFVQNKGWQYHWVPVWMTAFLLLTTIVLDAVERFGGAQRWFRVGAVGLVIGAAAYAVSELERVRQRPEFGFYQPVMVGVLADHARGGPVSALSVRLPPGLALVVGSGSPIRWGSRFNVLWPIPWLYGSVQVGSEGFPYHSPDARPELETFLLDSVTEDFLRERPTLLVVERTPPPGLDGFDLVEYFSQGSSDFAEEFRRYRPLLRLGDYDVYERAADAGQGERPSAGATEVRSDRAL